MIGVVNSIIYGDNIGIVNTVIYGDNIGLVNDPDISDYIVVTDIDLINELFSDFDIYPILIKNINENSPKD